MDLNKLSMASRSALLDHLAVLQAERRRFEEAASSHQAALTASDSRLQQSATSHAAVLADIKTAHEAAIGAAQSRLSQAEELIAQLHAEHVEEVKQCDAEYDEAHLKRHIHALKAGRSQCGDCPSSRLVVHMPLNNQ